MTHHTRPTRMRSPVRRRHSRSLLGYLALPRPGDTTKWLIVPLGFALGSLYNGGASRETLFRAFLVWVVLEFFIYQARYQWNDIRGFVADQQHPGETDRGRLPGPLERARSRIFWSATVAWARLGVAVGVALVLPQLDLSTVLLLVVAVFGVAVVYETLRSAATGRTGQVPAPLRPELIALWIVVGAGYALRGVTGLALAVDLTEPPVLAVAGVVSLWAFGVAFVTSRWVLEATAFASLESGHITWAARPEHAREHSLALTRWLPSTVDPRDLGSRDATVADWRAVQAGTSPSAPWNLAGVLAGTAAGLAGCLLANRDAPLGHALAASISTGLASVVVLAAGRRRGLATVVAAAVVIGVLALAGVTRPALATLPWLVITVAQAVAMQQCLSSIGRPLSGLRRTLRQAGGPR